MNNTAPGLGAGTVAGETDGKHTKCQRGLVGTVGRKQAGVQETGSVGAGSAVACEVVYIPCM